VGRYLSVPEIARFADHRVHHRPNNQRLWDLTYISNPISGPLIADVYDSKIVGRSKLKGSPNSETVSEAWFRRL